MFNYFGNIKLHSDMLEEPFIEKVKYNRHHFRYSIMFKRKHKLYNI